VHDLVAARDTLAGELREERERTSLQSRRAQEAEREASRASGTVEQLRGELAAARESNEQQRVEAARVQLELATAAAQLAAAREQVEREITHATERIEDQRQHTQAAERDAERLRAELDAMNTRHAGELEELRHLVADTATRSSRPDTGRAK
jgi:chromosome segregation ATPase